MRRPLSLALRLTLFYGIAAAMVFTGFGWIIGRSIEMHFKSEDVSELKIIVQAVHGAMSSVRSEEDLARLKGRFDDILAGHHDASLYITGQDQHVIFASAGPDPSTFIAMLAKSINGKETVREWSDSHNTYRVLIQRLAPDTDVSGGPFTVVVAVPIDYHLHFMDSFRHTLWLMIVCGIVITSVMGWIAVRQGHAPLRHIVNQIRQISANELKTRLSSETVPAELADLAASFNEMLERVEEAFQRLSNFSADIAHELRTPVTSLMTQTQVVLSQARSIEEYREILYSNIEEYERMAQMIGDMLFLAKADNRLCKPNTTAVDLHKEVHDLFDYYEVWAEERHVKLSLEGSAIVSGDRLMLRRALSNLLSNAIRHTPSGQTVWVKLKTGHNNGVDISVENPGTAIPSEHIPRLFDRFYRVDPSRQRSGEGTGLGLAIVKSIVDAHGGRIEVKSNDNYTIFQITLRD